MKTLNYLKIAVLFFCTLGLVACSDDDDTKGIDEMLCRTWVYEQMADNDGESVLFTHQLQFVRKGNSGQEMKKRYVVATGTTHSETRDFTWRWKDDSHECLVLSYGAGEVKYFENVWVRNHYLSGLIGGESVMFVDASYKK